MPKLLLMLDTWFVVCDIIQNLILQNQNNQKELYEHFSTYMNAIVFFARKANYVLKNDDLRFAKYLACLRHLEKNGISVSPIKLKHFAGCQLSSFYAKMNFSEFLQCLLKKPNSVN